MGRSPRGRGKPAEDFERLFVTGSIPAWAGEAQPETPPCRHRRVDPRVGGGSGRFCSARGWREGRSPRGRGKHQSKLLAALRARSIPAWAGEAPRCISTVSSGRVDPRVGGGSSPSCLPLNAAPGRSPRGRGKLQPSPKRMLPVGSIPAWAGEARGEDGDGDEDGVDPRVGGGSRRSSGSTLMP